MCVNFRQTLHLYCDKLNKPRCHQQIGGDDYMAKKAKDKNNITLSKVLHKLLKLLRLLYEIVILLKSIIKEFL